MVRIFRIFIVCLLMTACAGTHIDVPDGYIYRPVHTAGYDIATWQKISNNKSPIRIYIEGDGYAFNAYGHPTGNPTPRSNTLRKMAFNDSAPNVVYIARPCQFIMSDSCKMSDWTIGRFSKDIVDSVSGAVKHIALERPVILIGYSGGALLSGLVINQNPDIYIIQWITIAGVLNHSDWTKYFGDAPLSQSLSLDELPHINSKHYVAEYDKVVPHELSARWLGEHNITVVPGSTHSDFGNFIP